MTKFLTIFLLIASLFSGITELFAQNNFSINNEQNNSNLAQQRATFILNYNKHKSESVIRKRSFVNLQSNYLQLPSLDLSPNYIPFSIMPKISTVGSLTYPYDFMNMDNIGGNINVHMYDKSNGLGRALLGFGIYTLGSSRIYY